MVRVFMESKSLVPEDSEEEESEKQIELTFAFIYLIQIACKHSGSYHYK